MSLYISSVYVFIPIIFKKLNTLYQNDRKASTLPLYRVFNDKYCFQKSGIEFILKPLN